MNRRTYSSKVEPPMYPATLDQVRDWFYANGITISDWASAQDVSRDLVYAVLSGRIAGRSGKSHRIAVLLGLKPHTQPRTRAENAH